MRGTDMFAVGYLGGYVLLLVAFRCSASTRLRLYGPLLPFALGVWGAIPYAALLLGLASPADLARPGWNAFLGYAALTAWAGDRSGLPGAELQVALVGLAYVHLLARSFRLVRSLGAPRAQ